MASGKVKWFDNKKGYGFIVCDDLDSEVLVHHTAILTEGFRTLSEGEMVDFELVESAKGFKASNVRRAP